MDIPVPIPRNTQSRISTGFVLVPTAARELAPQNLPITSVSTIPYNCCKIFPKHIGRTNHRTFFINEPVVIST